MLEAAARRLVAEERRQIQTMSDGCRLPEDLYYWPEKHVWARPEADGTITVGMTDPAQSMAGKVVAISPKGVGKALTRGKSAGTAESGKWVGAVPAPVTGEVTEVNPAVKGEPALINSDPYGAGWIVRIKPTDWETQKSELVTGPAGIEKYRAFLADEGINCGDK